MNKRKILKEIDASLAIMQNENFVSDSALEKQVIALCEAHGYGRMMQIVSNNWRLKDPFGSFVIGPCAITVSRF